MSNDTTRTAHAAAPLEKSRFLDGSEGRVIVLGKLRTDDEAQLADEIEKLRDGDTRKAEQ